MPYFQGSFERHCLTTGAPSHLAVFTATSSILIMISNIPGNLLVILAVAIDPHKNLRNPFNFLMANLAVADLVVGTVTCPLSVFFHVKEGLNESLSLLEIRALHLSYFISCTASVLSVSTLAVERYLAIANPHTYRNKVTEKRILLTIGCIWLISLTLPFVYLEVGFITSAFIFANTSVAAAFGITCLTYTMMIYKFKHLTRNFGPTATFTNTNTNTNTNSLHPQVASPPDAGQALRDRAAQWEHKITKMFLVVMIALLCCYGTSTILIYAMSFCESCSCDTLHWFRDLHFLLIILNSSLNFYCYAVRSPRFQNAFVYILRIPRSRSSRNSGTF